MSRKENGYRNSPELREIVIGEEDREEELQKSRGSPARRFGRAPKQVYGDQAPLLHANSEPTARLQVRSLGWHANKNKFIV